MIKLVFLAALCLLLFHLTPFFPLDAMLVLVVVYSLNINEVQSLCFSFMAGIVSDITLPETKLLAPCFAFLGTLQSFSVRFIYRKNLFYVFIFVFLATLLKTTYLFIVMNVPPSLQEIKNIAPSFAKEAAANIMITPFFYRLLIKN